MRKIIIILATIFILTACENALMGFGERVDIEAPKVTFGSTESGSAIASGDYVSGVITLVGTMSDDKGVSSVIVKVDGISTSGILDFGSMTWSADIDTTTYADGEKDVIFEVSDASSPVKTTIIHALLYFDNTAPLIMVTGPLDFRNIAGYSNDTITINGEAYDEFMLEDISITLLSGPLGTTVDPISGKATWTSRLNGVGTGNYEIVLTATDAAGNLTTDFYHIDDIRAIEDPVPSISTINGIRNGIITTGYTLTTTDLTTAPLLLSQLPIKIDMSGDEPQISISNPTSGDTLTKNSKAIGTLTDDDGIDTSSIEIKFDDDPWISIESFDGSGLFVKWDHSFTALSGGSRTMLVRVKDIYGVAKQSDPVTFDINTDAPDLAITNPLVGDYLNTGTFTISGTAEDDLWINAMTIQINGGADIGVSSFTPGVSAAWSHDIIGQADGNILIKVKADDGGGTLSSTNVQFTIDTVDPTNSMLYPGHNSFVNGLVEIRGASSDNTLLEQVEVRIGDVDPWIIIPNEDKYNWALTFNSLDFENEFDADETSLGSGVWNLNIYTRITDKAGNVAETVAGDYVVKIDNSLDRPSVNIISPYNDQSLGGAVLVSGTSFDDDGAVFGVYMQIDVNTSSAGSPDFADTSVTLFEKDGTTPGFIDFDGSGGAAPVANIDETNWYLLNGKNPWTVELNTNGELYSSDGNTGDLYIRIKAIDKDGGVTSISGEYEELHIKMDDSVPYYANLLPVSNSYVKGIFNITGEVHDDTSLKHLEISYNGGAQYYDIIRDGFIDPSYGGGTATDTYIMNVPVDTASVPDVGNITSNTLSVRLKATDNTNYQTLQSLLYYVDNTLPTGTSSDFNDIEGSSSNAVISGTASDTGTVNGISHVEAYIVRDILGTKYFYDPKVNNSTIVASTLSINSVVHEYPIGGGYEEFLITIDNTSETLGGSNADGDGIAEELNVGINYDWKYMFDTNNIPDGPVELHYVVHDKAGNMNHYEQSGFIKNHSPVIESITLSTDLNGDGDILDSGEETTILPANFSASNFTGRNDLINVRINLEAGTGNAPVSYEVKFDNAGNPDLITSGSNALVDMSNHVTYADVSVNGAEFLCTITDNAGISTTQSIFVNIDNVDDVNPTVQFSELNADTSVPEISGVKQGHIEESSWSTHDNAPLTDPEISGTVIFNGSAHDDQRIQTLYMWIDTDGDSTLELGELITIANEDTDGTLKSNDAGLTIILETLTELSGHNVTFKYEWDSSSLTNVTGNDIKVKFLVEDYNSTPNTNSEIASPTVNYNYMTVDVVPYIRSIETNLDSAFSSTPSVMNRTALGNYTVSRNEVIKAYGFNINGTTTSTVNGSAMAESFGSDVDGDYIAVTISGTATSGSLELTTNGIISLNNVNDNDADSSGYKANQKPNGVNNNLLTDDTVMTVWNFTTIAGTTSARYPVMRISPAGTAAFSFAFGETDFRMILNNGTISNFERNYTRYNYTSMGFDGNGNVYGLALNSDRISNSYGGSTRLGFFYNQAGSRSTGGNDGYDNGTYKRHLEHNWNGTVYNSLRSQHPDMVVTGSGTAGDPANIYMTYFDDSNKQLKFRYGQVNGSLDGSVSGAISTNGDGDPNGSSLGFQIIESLTDDDDSVTGGVQSTINPGQYSSVAVTSTGTAVVAWYDITDRKLVYSYNTNPAGATESQWNDNYMVIDNVFAGQHVDISVDGNDDIHIAYYNSSSGNLKYAYLDDVTDTTADIVVVDSFLSVGQHIMIDSRLEAGEYIPYISYASSAYAGTQHSLKIASKVVGVSLDHGASFDQYTQNWEIMTVPATSIPKDYKVSVGFRAGRVTVGYASDAGLEYAELY